MLHGSGDKVNQLKKRSDMGTKMSSEGLLKVARIMMASVETAPLSLVLSFIPLIQPPSGVYSPSLMMLMRSPFLQLRNVASSTEGKCLDY